MLDHDTIECALVAGAGVELGVHVSNIGRVGCVENLRCQSTRLVNRTAAATFAYARPIVHRVEGADAHNASTAGGDVVTIVGSHLGEPGTAIVADVIT